MKEREKREIVFVPIIVTGKITPLTCKDNCISRKSSSFLNHLKYFLLKDTLALIENNIHSEEIR